MIGIVFCIIFILSLGFAIVRMVPQLNAFEKIGLSFGTGIGLVTMEMFLYSMFGIRWNLFFIVFPLIVAIVSLLFTHKLNIEHPRFFRVPEDILLRLILFGIASSIVVVSTEAILRPVIAWDAIASWFLGAKGFYIQQRVDLHYIKFANNSTPPLLNTLIAFSYFCMGQVNERYSMILYPFFYLALLSLFYGNVRRVLSERGALIMTFLFATVPDLMRHAGRFDVGNGDLPLAYFFLCDGILLQTFIQKQSKKVLILLQFFLSCGALVRSEGIPFLLFVDIALLIFLIKKKQTTKLISLFIAIIPVSVWLFLQQWFHLPLNPFVTTNFHIERVIPVIIAALLEMLNLSRWNLVWIAFALVVLVSRKIQQKLLITVLLLQLSVYVSIYFVTPLNPVSHLHNSFDRLLLHLMPLAMLIMAFSFPYSRIADKQNFLSRFFIYEKEPKK